MNRLNFGTKECNEFFVVDTLYFYINSQLAKENGMSSRMNGIGFNTFCGDDRYILVVIDRSDLKGLELNDKWLEKYRVSYKNMLSTSRGGVYVNVVGVIDKKRIGTESFNRISVTSK